MTVRFEHQGLQWEADLQRYVDLSIPISRTGPRAWGLGAAEIRPYRQGDFVGSMAAGASVNFNDIAFNPHAHGTHTECLGHITRDIYSVNTHPPKPWMLAALASFAPESRGTDRVITLAQVEGSFSGPVPQAVILRTLPNPETKKHEVYSGTNPPYLEASAAAWLARMGVEHLLLDLPSVDREADGGALSAHKAFWGLPDQPRESATITELVYVPDHVVDGTYLLNLQVAPFENDASPSRPLLFPVRRVDGTLAGLKEE
jgi:kynurenine formamidase